MLSRQPRLGTIAELLAKRAAAGIRGRGATRVIRIKIRKLSKLEATKRITPVGR